MMSMSNLAQLYQEIEDITSYKQIVDTIAEFFKKLEPDEAKIAAYLSLGSTGPKFEDTDMGLGNKFCLQAIAEAYDAGKDKVQKIFDEKGDLGDTAAYFCKRKKSSLSVKEVFDRFGIRRFSISFGRPVQAMLAKRVDSVEELSRKFPDKMAAEKKYDGERAQIHFRSPYQIKIFSRRLTEITSQFPDISEYVAKASEADKAVLDGEIVVFGEQGPGSFQRLMKRRRKYAVKKYKEKIPVVIYLFDILYLDGKSLLKKSYPERRELLENNKSKNRFETFTKVGSGFTDQDFKEIEEKLVRADKKPVDLFVDEHMEPDEYVEPDMVIEVLGAEITTSPKHTAGRGKSNKGFALRFPRFLHIRDDKATDQATTVEEILELKQAEQKRN